MVQPPRQFASWTVFSLALPVALALVSLLVPYFREPAGWQRPYEFSFPTKLPPWNGTVIGLDYFFPYNTATNPQFHAEYRNPDAPGGTELVDLFIARESPTSSGLDRMPNYLAPILIPTLAGGAVLAVMAMLSTG